ncbi:Argonaute-binding protein 1 like [Verticillium longisporum]|uniref:Argonaute-binding protein 1 like n=1 Tax=Verticillium longisporum TaxID=100787 RepID=A0A0G4LQL3_VERLO|nr:Argonaute-binding protein 1 like [Verticillium longisporum]CRK24311.1 hypothetical protein BN1723_013254 [Verticillium longisporum]
MAQLPDKCGLKSRQGRFAEIIEVEHDDGEVEGTNKKNRSKSGSARGPTGLTRSRGTGFETYYADPPVTPDEAREEAEELYPPHRPFVDRIEECIQRFRARRRLNTEMTSYFDTYLFLGGIDTAQRQFTGSGSNSKTNPDFQDMDTDEVRRATAVDMIHRDKNSTFYNEAEPERWEIDFTGIVTGYLSEAVPRLTGQNYTAMNTAVAVVENFLRYILHHGVCPEYDAGVRSALAQCLKARVDLPKAHHALIAFPGEFGLAAAELFCDDYMFFPRESMGSFKRAEGFDARTIFATGILLAGTDTQVAKLLDAGREFESVRVFKEEDYDLEVISVNRPSQEIRQQYKSVCLLPSHPALQPIGITMVKPCVIEDGYDVGMLAAAQELNKTEREILLDDDILYFLQPGMKIRATVCELTVGVTFIKSVADVLVPWFVFLPQTLMRRFREPRVNDRPAPSATEPGAADDDAENEE